MFEDVQNAIEVLQLMIRHWNTIVGEFQEGGTLQAMCDSRGIRMAVADQGRSVSALAVDLDATAAILRAPQHRARSAGAIPVTLQAFFWRARC